MNDWKLIQILNQKECDYYISKLYKLKNHWISRYKNLPFYTLGMAAYLDKDGNYDNIAERHKYNKILQENFNDLYLKIIPLLSFILQSPVELYNNASVPGFHIYLQHEGLKTARTIHHSTPHMDTQFRHVFREPGFKLKDFISFTLPIACSNESGLNIWNPDISLPDDILDLLDDHSTIKYTNKDALSKYTAQSIYQKPTFIQYKPGHIFIHNGVFYHYPVLGADKSPRVTLQGHGIKKDGKFLLFW